MSIRTKRLAILGYLPLTTRNLETSVILKKAKRLERDGWIMHGEGFADSGMLISVYKSYYRDELVVVERRAAIPHYQVSSSTPDYWMYGEVIKRHYCYHQLADDSVTNRGISYHKTARSLTFKHCELRWELDECGGYSFD